MNRSWLWRSLNIFHIFRAGHVCQPSPEGDTARLWELQPTDQHAFETVRAGQGPLEGDAAAVLSIRKGRWIEPPASVSCVQEESSRQSMTDTRSPVWFPPTTGWPWPGWPPRTRTGWRCLTGRSSRRAGAGPGWCWTVTQTWPVTTSRQLTGCPTSHPLLLLKGRSHSNCSAEQIFLVSFFDEFYLYKDINLESFAVPNLWNEDDLTTIVRDYGLVVISR